MSIESLKKKIEARRLNFKPVLPESEIVAFETGHGVVLPKEYRDFLLNVGNGGDGPPLYNIPSLGKAPNDAYEHEREVWEDFIKIDREFPFTETWIWENEQDQASESFEKKVESAYYGSIALGTDGCGMNWLLIVTGKSRGEIWQLTDVGIGRCEPKLNFIEWYEHWLENGDDVNYFGKLYE